MKSREFPRSWDKAHVRKITANLVCRSRADAAAMDVANKLVKKVRAAKGKFGPKCGKFSGAVAAECVRARLLDAGMTVSRRDVFIRGLPIELDLIVPRRGATPRRGLLYEPADVRAVLEVKNCGCFGEPAVKTVRSNFKRIRDHVPGVTCVYITLEERPTYRFAVTDARVNAPAFTLAWHKNTDDCYWPTTDWRRLISLLRKASRQGASRIHKTGRHT